MTADKDPRAAFEAHWHTVRGTKQASRELRRREEEPQTYIQDSANRHWITWQASREQALSEAADACKRLYVEYNANQYTAPMSAALVECEEQIRSLK